jgi:hypothetical protein
MSEQSVSLKWYGLSHSFPSKVESVFHLHWKAASRSWTIDRQSAWIAQFHIRHTDC